MDPNTAKDPEMVKAMVQRKKELMKEPAMAGEGNMFAQAVQKAKAAGMKAGDKFKVGDQEYTLKDAIEIAGMQLEDFFSEEEQAYDAQIDRIKNLALYQ
jgi:phage-related tail protein